MLLDPSLLQEAVKCQEAYREFIQQEELSSGTAKEFL